MQLCQISKGIIGNDSGKLIATQVTIGFQLGKRRSKGGEIPRKTIPAQFQTPEGLQIAQFGWQLAFKQIVVQDQLGQCRDGGNASQDTRQLIVGYNDLLQLRMIASSQGGW